MVNKFSIDNNSESLDIEEFIRASFQGDIKTVKKYIDSTFDINKVGQNMSTALYNAISNEHYDIIEILLKNGADVNKGALYKQTPPLHNAIDIEIERFLNDNIEPDLKIIKLLLKYNADINKKDYEGRTAIDYAALVNHKKAEELLKNYKEN